MRLILHEKVGIAALESLNKFPPPTVAELEGRLKLVLGKMGRPIIHTLKSRTVSQNIAQTFSPLSLTCSRMFTQCSFLKP